jgi:hypothetical protein
MKQISSKEIINQYQQYISLDEPIPYIAKNMIDIYIQVKKKIQEVKTTLTNNEEENKLKKETINNMEKSLEGMVLQIYPFTIKDYFYFGTIQCLQVKKNETPDPKIISMKYLDFLFNDEGHMIELLMLLKTCLELDESDIRYRKDEKDHIVLILNGIEYTWQDFDLMKEIICCQNILDYDNRYIDPKFRKAMDSVKTFKNRNKIQPTLEELMSCIVASTGYKYEEIYDMTIRKFYMTLSRTSYKVDYQIIKTGMYNGTVKPDEHMLHWQDSFIKENKYSDCLADFDTFKNKIGDVGDIEDIEDKKQ